MSRARRDFGFSLIELLVSMAIGLVLTAAIAAVMVSSEGDKRGSTSLGDMNQSGSFATYLLDRHIRAAGSGFAYQWRTLFGCTIYAQSSQNTATTSVLPRTFTAPAFSGWNTTAVPIGLAPVLINAGAGVGGNDILMVMAGTGAFNEVPPQVLPGVTSSLVRLANTVGFRNNDLVLIGDTVVPGQCVVQQVNFPSGTSGGATQSLPLGNGTSGGYAVAAGAPALTQFGQATTAVLAQIGNFDGNLPQFTLYGVDGNNALVATDLLPASGSPTDNLGTSPTTPVVADNVMMLRALYGVMQNGAIQWVSPATAPYRAQDLLPGPGASLATAQANLKNIVAIRIGLVLRGSVPEPKPVAGAAPKLFEDVPASTVTGPSPTTAPYYRYRAVEATIPLPNVVMAP